MACPEFPGSKPGSAMPDPSHVQAIHAWKTRCKKDEATDIGTRRMDRGLKGTWSKKTGLHGRRAKITLVDQSVLPAPSAGRSPPSSVGRKETCTKRRTTPRTQSSSSSSSSSSTSSTPQTMFISHSPPVWLSFAVLRHRSGTKPVQPACCFYVTKWGWKASAYTAKSKGGTGISVP